MRPLCPERGAVLIIVLGVVAIVAAWAATAAYEDMISLRRAENMLDSSRARMADESAVELARHYLSEDIKDNQVDHLDEAWATPLPPLPIDNGMVSGTIEDANRYFNLNDLVDKDGQAQPEAIAIVRRLFTLLEIEPQLVDRLVDWMDADDKPLGSAGAEDFHYYDKPYRVKNARLDRWQELTLIDGFDSETLEKLARVATVRIVPESGRSSVNINTADAVLLMAFFPNMNDIDAAGLIDQRPFDGVAQATSEQPWADGADLARLSVASDAFIVRTDALFGRARWREEYLVTRTADGKTAVEYRERQRWMN